MTQSKFFTVFFTAVVIGTIFTSSNLLAQDYSSPSNFLTPDTLKADQKMIFDHFIKWTSQKVKDLEPMELYDEFEKVGITMNNVYRLRKALHFVRGKMTHHKKSVERWENFKYLNPAENKE